MPSTEKELRSHLRNYVLIKLGELEKLRPVQLVHRRTNALKDMLATVYDSIIKEPGFISTEINHRLLTVASIANEDVPKWLNHLAQLVVPLFEDENKFYNSFCINNSLFSDAQLANSDFVTHELVTVKGLLRSAYFNALLKRLDPQFLNAHDKSINNIKQQLINDALMQQQHRINELNHQSKTKKSETLAFNSGLGFGVVGSFILLPIAICVAIVRGVHGGAKVNHPLAYLHENKTTAVQSDLVNFCMGFMAGFLLPFHKLALAIAEKKTDQKIELYLESKPNKKSHLKRSISYNVLDPVISADPKNTTFDSEIKHAYQFPTNAFHLRRSKSEDNLLAKSKRQVETITERVSKNIFSFIPFQFIDSFDIYSLLDVLNFCF